MNVEKEIERLIELALKEDIRQGDITTAACISEEAASCATVVLKQSAVIAGLPFLPLLFQKIDPRIQVETFYPEGSFQKAGTTIASVKGPLRGILSGERVALNLLQHACGVATTTSAYARKIREFNCAILDTRKTLPGLRALEKYAVRVGGGRNHRFGLDERFVIKIKHLLFLQAAGFSEPIIEATLRAKMSHPDLAIETEVESLAQTEEALKTDASVLILVNMTSEEVKKCMDKIKKTDKKAYVESAGAITLDTVRAYAKTGAHGICISDLTYSVPACDIRIRLT